MDRIGMMEREKRAWRVNKSGIFLILILLTLLLTSGTASAYWSQQALICDSGNSTGADTTDYTCGSTTLTPPKTGLLLPNASSTSTYVRIGANGNGPWIYAYFINNTAFPNAVNVTGYNGSMSFRAGATTSRSNAKYELGYYNPNGPSGNFVGLFNSTDVNISTTAQASYNNASFNRQDGIIPSGNKLAVRVWVWVNGTATRPYFYSHTTTAAANSSFIIDIGPAYNLSGYITNKTSGAPLSGVTVTTNTSLTTTTNETGYYKFEVGNGTYTVTASSYGYDTNSTTRTINGNDVTNADILLPPATSTYQLSGYVTNKTGGAALSGVAVITNTSLKTTTDATGYYSFTVYNWTHQITAGKTGYSDNTTTQIISGASASNVNILLAPVQPKILVAVNRYAIFDDWSNTGKTGQGFSLAGAAHSTDELTGKNTRINATALYIDSNGFPVEGKNISFTLYDPNGTINTTKYGITDSNGLANFSLDMNKFNFYGKWNVNATNGTLASGNTTFIYNWMGCGISGCNSGHPSDSLGTVGAYRINSPYQSGREAPSWSNHASATCTDCHQSYDGQPGGNTAGGANHTQYTQDVHKNIACDNVNCHQTNAIHGAAGQGAKIASCYNTSGGCHVSRNDISNKSTLNSSNVATALSLYSYANGTVFNNTFHTPDSTVPCIICHGPMHNITKSDPLTGSRNTITEDSHCTTCHSNYSKHNANVGCTLCHSDDVHTIQVFSQQATFVNATGTTNPARGNCTTCHQNSSFMDLLKWNQANQPKGGHYSGRSAPQIPAPMNHSTDPYSGTLWNQSAYWDNKSQYSACNYCHDKNESLHNSLALGKINKVKGMNTLGQSLVTGRWCVNCHYKNAPEYAGTSFSPEPPEILNASGKLPSKARDGTNFENHSGYVISGYNDSICKDCHAIVGSYGSTSLNYSHSLDIGVAGGPDCTQCHNIGGSATGKLVNFSAMNDTLSIHKNLNSGVSTLLPPANKKCWACHGSGSEPASGHPAGYKTPSRCVDCHVTRQNLNYTPNNTLLNVTEHYWNGTDIDPSSATSCYSCHNKSEMMIPASDPDSGTGAVWGGANGGNNSSSHYGRKRTDYPAQDTRAYCNKCHSNQSTVFPFADNNNKTISNHSMNYPATNPVCKDCHGPGRIHNSTLQRPVMTLQNSSYCLGCHGTGGTAAIKNLERHNGSAGLNCTQCHLNSTRSIHPVRYLQQDGINWQQTRTSAVNCTTCHQTGLVNFSDAPIIPDPIKHSSNISNGSIWGTYWTSESDSCYYCHNNTKHNSTALGRISTLMTDLNNTRNGSLTVTTWCADCHYNASVNTKYKGNLWMQTPPLITVNNTGKNYWENHSGYLGGGYKDSDCITCHALNGTTYLSTSLNYSHSLNVGVNGGPNCTACHNIGGSAGPTRTVNFTAANNSLVAHRNLNSGVSTLLPPGNKKCWACHGDGSQPAGGHPAKYNTPYSCADCHVPGTGQNLNYTPGAIINVNQHYPDSVFSGTFKHSTNYTEGSCQVCHNNSIQYNNIQANLNATVSHYATTTSLPQTNLSSSCGDTCHNNTVPIWGAPAQLQDAYGHSYKGKACQASCHNTYYKNATNVNSVNLHNASVGIHYNCYVEDCHASRPGR